MKTVTDLFEQHLGAHEYNGIVETIQRWFYGYLYKASWCATSMSYFMDQLGLLDQIGGKNENVCLMMQATERAHKALKKGVFLYRDDIKPGMNIPRGTIVFNLYSGKPMTTTSSKHVTSVYESFDWTPSGKYQALGGNQGDEISIKTYNRGNVYAIYIPDYEQEDETHKTLKRTSPTMKGDDVTELQIDLNNLGYPSDDYRPLEIDGSYGPKTEQAVKRFQKATGLEVDGVCGPKTWAEIERQLNADPKYVRILTDVYIRLGPGTNFKTKSILRTGAIVVYSIVEKGWAYLPKWGGWITTKKEYVKLI